MVLLVLTLVAGTVSQSVGVRKAGAVSAGPQAFTDINAGLTPSIFGSAAWGDYTNDGRLDLVVTGLGSIDDGFGAFTTLYRNNGDGTFSEDTNAGLPAASLGAAAWGDYDNDGRPDLVLSGIGFIGLGTEVLHNESAAASAAPAAPTGLRARLTDKRWVTFSWDSSSSKTSSNAISYNLRVGTTPGGSDIVSAAADSSGFRRLPETGNAEGRTFAKLRIIKAGTYYWSVQAVNAAAIGSGFAAEQTFVIPPSISIAVSP